MKLCPLYYLLQKLYTYAGNKDGFKALIAAQYANVNIDIPPFRMGVDNKSDDFYKMSPRGQVRKGGNDIEYDASIIKLLAQIV